MRRGTLAVALLLAVLFPVPSPAADAPESAAPEASAASREGEAAAADEAPEAGEKAATASEEASPGGEEAEASDEGSASDASEASSDDEEASGDESSTSEESASDESEGEGGSDEDESFFTPFVEYANNVSTQFLTGLNGILTWPADPVMATVNPPKAFDKAGYPRRPLGFASGLLLMCYRGFTGALDLVLAPGPLPVLSPVPRYKLVPGFEHEDE